MNTITQHIPNFAYNGEERKTWNFETVDELLGLEWVKSFHKKDHTFMVSDSNNLMTVADDNSWWWVIGKLEHPVAGLPVWRSGYQARQCPTVTLTDDVEKSLAEYNKIKSSGSAVAIDLTKASTETVEKFRQLLGQ